MRIVAFKNKPIVRGGLMYSAQKKDVERELLIAKKRSETSSLNLQKIKSSITSLKLSLTTKKQSFIICVYKACFFKQV